jgi:hypothetical protein
MEHAEFEEKDYEGPLYHELLSGNHRISTPGQVFESAFGIDAMMEAHHPLFWDLWGYMDIPAGIMLNDYRWGWVWRRHGSARKLPTFQVNLLIQAKRPDYLRGKRVDLSRCGISGGYWRFAVREHQQVLLEQLERRLRNRALVVYATPVFHELGPLYDHIEKQAIVENSSFVRPTRMKGHHHWNYDKPGCVGAATSEPEAIEDADFITLLSKAVENSESIDPKESLLGFEKEISLVVTDNASNPIAQFYKRVDEKRLNRIAELVGGRSPLLPFLKISTFLNLLNTRWLIAGNSHK